MLFENYSNYKKKTMKQIKLTELEIFQLFTIANTHYIKTGNASGYHFVKGDVKFEINQEVEIYDFSSTAKV